MILININDGYPQMLKSMHLRQQALLVDWSPETVGQCLQQHVHSARDLLQPTRKQHKQLVKDLFLLSTRASLSSSQQSQHYADLLAHTARAMQQLYQTTRDSIRSNTDETRIQHATAIGNANPGRAAGPAIPADDAI